MSGGGHFPRQPVSLSPGRALSTCPFVVSALDQTAVLGMQEDRRELDPPSPFHWGASRFYLGVVETQGHLI